MKKIKEAPSPALNRLAAVYRRAALARLKT